jgi:uncharacterized surface protein with fasciclin (FAS1) repeats
MKSSMQFVLVMLFFGMVYSSCDPDPDIPDLTADQYVITDYVKAHPDQFTEFGKLLDNTGLSNMLAVRGPFTLLLPSDSAMKVYYTEQNITSVNDLAIETQRDLVYNHLILTEIQSSDIGLGSLRQANALGDKLSTEFVGEFYENILVNKQSIIVKRDIRTSNGYIHYIDNVIEPVTNNVFQQVASDPSYSIFTEGLVRTGLSDTLRIVDFPYGTKTARTNFTLLAVSDSIFNSNGIYSINDLISRYTDAPTEIDQLENGFYRYMEYHCLTGTYYFSDFDANGGKAKLYPILSYDNNVSLILTNDFKLNFDKTTSLYTGFIEKKSNYPAKNGTVHSVNGLLEVITPDPAVFTFETTDYFDLKQGDYYKKYYQKFSDGQNTFAKIKWEGMYLQYYYKTHSLHSDGLINNDCLNMMGFGWIEITTPKIMKGKYMITGNIWSGHVDFEVYVDGVLYKTIKGSDPSKTTEWATVEWNKTEEHKVKVVPINWSGLFWDTVIFTPIK